MMLLFSLLVLSGNIFMCSLKSSGSSVSDCSEAFSARCALASATVMNVARLPALNPSRGAVDDAVVFVACSFWKYIYVFTEVIWQ